MTLRSASSWNTTEGAAVDVVEEDVLSHSLAHSSAAIWSMRSWAAWNMMRRLEARMSAQWKNSHEIEVSRSNVEVEVKPKRGKWKGEYQKKS